jgi:hypothetical protein
MRRALLVLVVIAGLSPSCSERCPLEPHQATCEDLYGVLRPPQGVALPVRDIRVRTPGGVAGLERDLSFCLPRLPGSGAGIIVATVGDTLALMLGYVFPEQVTNIAGDVVPLTLGEELRSVVEDPAGGVQISAASTALGIIMLNPFIGGTTVSERALFASRAARLEAFGRLTADVVAAMDSAPEDLFDPQVNPGLYEQAMLIVSNLIDLEGLALGVQSEDAPYVLDAAGDYVDIVNPTCVYFGGRVASQGGEEPDTVFLIPARSVETMVAPGPVTTCHYLLGSGRFDFEFYKGLAGFSASRLLDPSHPGGLATLANAEQVLWHTLTIAIAARRSADPGGIGIADSVWVDGLAGAIEAGTTGRVLDLAVDYLRSNAETVGALLGAGYVEPTGAVSYLGSVRGILEATTGRLESLGLTARLPFHCDLFGAASHESLLVCQRDGVIVPCETPPVLSGGSVAPDPGYTRDRFEYCVDYYAADGAAPEYVGVVIDGTPVDMSLASGEAGNGTYACETELTGGPHTYYFRCVGFGGAAVRFPEAGWIEGPTVAYAPELSGGTVSPGVGSVDTHFRFDVHCFDGDGDTPLYVRVHVDGGPGRDMSLASGVPGDGLYRYETTLALGTHEYHFECADPSGAQTRYPAAGALAGPVVYSQGGKNPDAKMAVHVRPHNAKAGCDYGGIGACWDIVTTEPNSSFDAFPVFYRLTEYQAVEYGLTWPQWTYSAAWHSCCDATLGEILWPGDGVTQMWQECQSGWAAVPGFIWLYADYPGQVCPCDHPSSHQVLIFDCSGGVDMPVWDICAGVYGAEGIDPCSPWIEEPLGSGQGR